MVDWSIWTLEVFNYLKCFFLKFQKKNLLAVLVLTKDFTSMRKILSKYFCLQSFVLKDLVSLLFSKFTVSVTCHHHGKHQRESFWNLGLQIDRKCISDTFSSVVVSDSDFSWNFRVLLGVLKKSWLDFP